MKFVGVLTYEIHGRELLRAPRQVVIATHRTLIDVVFLVACIPNAVCIIKERLFRNFAVGSLVRSAGYISNTDPEQLLKDSIDALNGGATLVIFPEGTRSADASGDAVAPRRGLCCAGDSDGSHAGVDQLYADDADEIRTLVRDSRPQSAFPGACRQQDRGGSCERGNVEAFCRPSCHGSRERLFSRGYSTSMSDVETVLKTLIIETLELEDTEVDDIVSDEPLFGDEGGLGLDSIDALEIGLVLQERYGIELDPEEESTREHFYSVSKLAALVRTYIE